MVLLNSDIHKYALYTLTVKVLNKPQLDNKIGVKAQVHNYEEGNATRAFLLELLGSQIRLLTHGASQTAHLRCVCNNKTFYLSINVFN